jgi:hypothetical protein
MIKETPELPSKIAKYFDLSTEDISMVEHYTEINVYIKTLQKYFTKQGIKWNPVWYTDKATEKKAIVCYFWTNRDFEIFGFTKHRNKEGENITYPFHLQNIVKPLVVKGVF